MSNFRAFVAGPPRTGTSTICYALQRAGLNAAHGKDPVSHNPLAVLVQRAMLEGGDPLRYLPRYIEAVADCHVTRTPKWDLNSSWPTFIPGFWRRLREHHPTCLVILNTRATAKWIASVARWKDLRDRIIKADLPFLPPSMGGSDRDLGQWFEDYYARVRAELAGDPNMVEFDIEDQGAHRLFEERLGLDLPWWGTLNANPATPPNLHVYPTPTEGAP